jgi:hypothetical protein
MENLDPNLESPLGVVTSDVPLPAENSRRKINSTARILGTMKVGDSIRLSRIEHSAIFANARTAKIRITTRAIDSETFQVWRLPDEETAAAQP